MFNNFTIEDIIKAKKIEKERKRIKDNYKYIRKQHKFYEQTNELRKYKTKFAKLKRTYGIDEYEYLQLLIDQNFCCAICNIEDNKLKEGLVLDHDHDTGEIRGLLCNPCNMSIGLIKHDIQIAQKQIEYLEKYEG